MKKERRRYHHHEGFLNRRNCCYRNIFGLTFLSLLLLGSHLIRQVDGFVTARCWATYRPCHDDSTKKKTIVLSHASTNTFQSLRRHPSWYTTSRRRRNQSNLPRRTISATTSTCFYQAVFATMGVNPATSTTTTIGAIIALLGSSFVGLQVDRFLPSTGILGTLVTAALFSNLLSIVPSTHYLYDLCWNTFLPGSLALLLLAFRTSTTTNKKSSVPTTVTTTTMKNEEVGNIRKEFSVSRSIKIVALPFFISSIASLIGCLTSFTVWTKWLISTATTRSRWGLSLQDARVATACLSASFVGGSVNFFATAKLIKGNYNSLLGSLATSDLIVMAIYFAFLTYALQSNYFRKLYATTNPTQATTRTNTERIVDETETSLNDDYLKMKSDIVQTNPNKEGQVASDNTTSKNVAMVNNKFDDDDKMSWVAKIRAGVLVSSLALGIVRMANVVEDKIGRWIPGTACAVIAVVAPAINSFFENRVSSNQTGESKTTVTKEQRNGIGRRLWKDMQTMASPLSDVMFQLLFASIGTSANLRQALKSGPACLGFSSLALSLHILITFVGCRLVRSWRGIFGGLLSGQSVQLEDVLIASNAAIGGPATAAAFCSQMKSSHDGPSRLRGWTMAATFWGVFGYAIGTMIGVGMYRLVGGT